MIKNYFKIAWRNLVRNRSFSLTNLIGLTIGITSAILILLTVSDELSYDKFHKNYDTIYQILANRDFKNQIFTDRNMVLPLAKEIQENIPQVENAVVTTQGDSPILEVGETRIRQFGFTVSERFFDIFSWKFIRGNAEQAIVDPRSIVLTESAAMALFGEENPIGKSIRVNHEEEVQVTAVVQDPPGNSTFQFDFIVPFNYSDEDVIENMDEWDSSRWRVFVQAPAGTDVGQLDKDITELKRNRSAGDEISTYFTFPMAKWRLYSDFRDGKNIGGMILYIRMFIAVALIILLIACVNFMNLATAQSERRAKEIGVKKTLGSEKKQLVAQFYLEAIILSVAAFVLSLVAVFFLLPTFNRFFDKELLLDPTNPLVWLGALGIIIITGLTAGSYPALYLSSFSPLSVLSGNFSAGKKSALPRKVLVVAQFTISILLISATIVITQQIKHVKNRDIGYNPNNLITIFGTDDTQRNFQVLKEDLKKTGYIEAVTKSSSPITNIWWRSASPSWPGKPDDLIIIFGGLTTDVDFVETMGTEILEGKFFSGLPSDSSGMILNQAAVQVMGLENPIGMQMQYGEQNYRVIGVMDNLVMESPFSPVNPLMIYYNPEYSDVISIRLKEGASPQEALAAMEPVFLKHNPNYPFEYEFVDEEFQEKYATEELISGLINIFAILAIFICCLGLAGLVSYTVEKRRREIGIRKVLGATIQQILLMVSKDFIWLIAIALLLAVPFSWWLMRNWLQNFEYRIDIQWWVFVLAGALAITIAFLTISLQSIKAAMANPVNSLRTE